VSPQTSNIEQGIRLKVTSEFSPVHFELINESASHHRNPDGETHFKIILVSEKFKAQSLVQRQRSVMALLQDERSRGLHALTLKTLTPEEWSRVQNNLTFESPTCQGLGK